MLCRRGEKENVAGDACLSHFNAFKNVSTAENIDVAVLFDGCCHLNSTASVAVALEHRHDLVTFADALADKLDVIFYLSQIDFKI